jgi:hypothetical protein
MIFLLIKVKSESIIWKIRLYLNEMNFNKKEKNKTECFDIDQEKKFYSIKTFHTRLVE